MDQFRATFRIDRPLFIPHLYLVSGVFVSMLSMLVVELLRRSSLSQPQSIRLPPPETTEQDRTPLENKEGYDLVQSFRLGGRWVKFRFIRDWDTRKRFSGGDPLAVSLSLKRTRWTWWSTPVSACTQLKSYRPLHFFCVVVVLVSRLHRLTKAPRLRSSICLHSPVLPKQHILVAHIKAHCFEWIQLFHALMRKIFKWLCQSDMPLFLSATKRVAPRPDELKFFLLSTRLVLYRQHYSWPLSILLMLSISLFSSSMSFELKQQQSIRLPELTRCSSHSKISFPQHP
jgi:hypothetical protein